MAVRLEVESEVSNDGVVHVPMPDLAPGSRVKVVIEEGHPSAPSGERVLGRLKGKIHILPGFDDPMEGLEWAYE